MGNSGAGVRLGESVELGGVIVGVQGGDTGAEFEIFESVHEDGRQGALAWYGLPAWRYDQVA